MLFSESSSERRPWIVGSASSALSFAMAADEMGDARLMAAMKTIAIKRIILTQINCVFVPPEPGDLRGLESLV